ncbi:MAG: nucleoside monophosphate kinase [Clostridia bacterium]|nr:nucleoside monophosphate kinase [Clostridia bacterium]
MKIILLGAPNSGKGTLSANLNKALGFIGVSTGDLLRKEIASGSELGKHISSLTSAGKLVETETVITLMQNYINSLPKDANLMFDGFPRSVEQAKMLENIADIDAVLFLDVDEKTIMERALGRITCPKCGQIYNRAWYKLDTCEKCGEKLVVRSDDNEESVKNRIVVYKNSTYPLIDYYTSAGLLERIDAGKDAQNTLEQALKILKCIEAKQ